MKKPVILALVLPLLLCGCASEPKKTILPSPYPLKYTPELVAAAEAGDAAAQYTLGRCYHKGLGVEADTPQSVAWWKKAAEQDYDSAQYNLAVCLYNGLGVDSDCAEAVKLWKRLADKGDREAQYNMGCAYSFGKGVAKNDTMAACFFTTSARQQYAEAEYNLACCYGRGLGVEKNPELAIEWCRLAAKHGSQKAIDAMAEIDREKAAHGDK